MLKYISKHLEPTLVAKSNIILDVKPWDDETDMKELEKAVRQVTTDGLLWGACEFLFFVTLSYALIVYPLFYYTYCYIYHKSFLNSSFHNLK